MSQATFALAKGKSLAQLKNALKFATIAKDTTTDASVHSHFEKVKAIHDQVLAEKDSKQEESFVPS